GYWHAGVPPSGPMDPLAFRFANRLAGNAESAAALECAMNGPALHFHSDTVIAITGADMRARLDDQLIPIWQAINVRGGSTLRLGSATEGARTYVAIHGGIDVPTYLNSRSTFILGKFGGHAGRTLRTGDILRWNGDGEFTEAGAPPECSIPRYSHEWVIGVVYGPHGAPDFFTGEDIETIFRASWKVHYNSDRTGVRLIGPRPKWARKDGSEAGLHPSNLHDNAYAVGAMDFTGDMPVMLGPDGPSLGGFVCPLVVVHDELWKLGQLRPGDSVRFLQVGSVSDASAGSRPQNHLSPILHRHDDTVYRASGDRYLLIEVGPNVL